MVKKEECDKLTAVIVHQQHFQDDLDQLEDSVSTLKDDFTDHQIQDAKLFSILETKLKLGGTAIVLLVPIITTLLIKLF